MKESDILYQAGKFWVTENKEGQFEINLDGLIHSVGIGEAYPSLDLAIARTDFIAKTWDADKHFRRLIRQRTERKAKEFVENYASDEPLQFKSGFTTIRGSK